MGHSFGRNLDGFACFGVATEPCLSFLQAKTTEASEFDSFSRLESFDDAIQNSLDHNLGLSPG